MYFVWIGAFLIALKLMQIGPFGELSWWWVTLPLMLGILWFEGLEKFFGMHRRQLDHNQWEKGRKKRVAEQFAVRPKK